MTPRDLFINSLFSVQKCIKKKWWRSWSLLHPTPTPIPPWTLVHLLDGEQERQERRAEKNHTEGSSNDMYVGWEMREQQASQTFEAGVDVGPLAVGGGTHLCMGAVLHSLALSRSAGRACTPELLSLPLEICYSTTFLLQSLSLSFPELGGQHPTEWPSLLEQPPRDGMRIYSLITQIYKWRKLSWWGFLKKWLKLHFDPDISSDFVADWIKSDSLFCGYGCTKWLMKIFARKKRVCILIFHKTNPSILTYFQNLLWWR